ncbi:dolichol kinase-like isoform X1 [Uloborus diversus]|uniref:dolichol kinase-like isoform X1 n=1 Tax=Uloborus diversus TaxID=327109 RepID=UPI00240918C9|nr:dolichol kinase-like isoform X1 [Uloborus diversus]
MHHNFRNADSPGVWGSHLLPLCLLPLTIASNTETSKLLFAFTSVLSMSFFLKECTWKEKTCGFYASVIFSCLLSTPVSALISWYTESKFSVIYIVCLLTILYYNSLASSIMISCPRSFTVGELQIISQTITLVLLFTVISILLRNDYITSARAVHPLLDSTKFLQILLSGSIFLMHIFHKVPYLTIGKVMSITFLVFAPLLITSWSVYLQRNPIIWLISFCLKNEKRKYLIIFWIFCSLAAIIFVIVYNIKPRKIKLTIVRKYFHFVIDAVFISGMFYDPELLYLASAIALTVFVFLEACRLVKIPFIGSVIDDAFRVFLDEKDAGTLILTHIYLLVGCSLPIWLYGFTQPKIGYHICQLSGIISVGFGDTLAALYGASYGKHFWKGSNKTLEGTVSAIVIQLLCAFLFLSYGHEFSEKNILLIILAVIFTSILEAKTAQIDNLILPLFMLLFLAWIS